MTGHLLATTHGLLDNPTTMEEIKTVLSAAVLVGMIYHAPLLSEECYVDVAITSPMKLFPELTWIPSPTNNI